MSTKVAVIVSTYNRPRALTRVLQGLAKQFLKPDQIVIADDGSQEETRSLIEKWKTELPQLEHCWQDDFGFRKTKILNAAVRKSNCDHLIFLDGDCIPFPTFVADHINHTQAGVVLAGGRILTTERFTKRLLERLDQQLPNDFTYWLRRYFSGDIDRLSLLLRLPGSFWRLYASGNWRLVRGCNFSVSREALLSVNGFDESYSGWGFEDSDIAIRLINSGLRVKTLRFSAPVLHLWHPEESRNQSAQNHQELMSALRLGRTRAVKGLDNA